MVIMISTKYLELRALSIDGGHHMIVAIDQRQ